MGFNISVCPKQDSNNLECRFFIDRGFYDFVHSGEIYREQSILTRSGQYYGVDLSPLLKLVYTWDGVSQNDVDINLQQTDELLSLVTSFRDRIEQNSLVCNNITYVWRDAPIALSEQDRQTLIPILSPEAIEELFNTPALQDDAEKNFDPWRSYFEDKLIIRDLNTLIRALQCCKDKGFTEVYLIAG